ncbi:hypothetical protein B484DRAFT_411401, partial [Ochromonadaceae sp. CCMP2298]
MLDRQRRQKHTDPGAAFSAERFMQTQLDQSIYSLNMSHIDILRGMKQLDKDKIGFIPSRSTVQRAHKALSLSASSLFRPSWDSKKCMLSHQADVQHAAREPDGEFDTNTDYWREARAFGVGLTLEGAMLKEGGKGCLIEALKPNEREIIELISASGRRVAATGLPRGGEQSTDACIISAWLQGKNRTETNMELSGARFRAFSWYADHPFVHSKTGKLYHLAVAFPMDLKAIWTLTGLGGGPHICRHMCPFCPQLSTHQGSYSLYRCHDCLRVDPHEEFPCCHTEFVIGAAHELALSLQEARDAARQAGTALILLEEAAAIAQTNSTLAIKALTAAARPGASAA